MLLNMLSLMAQETDLEPLSWRNTSHSFMIGVGYSNQLDTYLSLLEYKGTEIDILRETLRSTHYCQGKISVQTLFQGDISYLRSPTHDGTEWSGEVDYSIHWHYNFQIMPSLRILVGSGLQGGIGFLYNLRNGNNPAQLKAAVNIPISSAAIWKFRLFNYPFSMRYQADIPFVGFTFSPNYGQSYYEIFSLGESDNNICFTSLFKAFSIKQLLSFDIPIKGNTLRLGYLGRISQYEVNNLKYHKWSSSFMMGFVKHFTLVKSYEKQHKNFIY